MRTVTVRSLSGRVRAVGGGRTGRGSRGQGRTAEGRGISVDGEAEAVEAGWEVDPDDEWGVAVIATVGRQLKLRREAVGMRAGEFGVAVGYGEDLVYKVEGGKRIPRLDYLDKADEVLGAGGLISAMKEDVRKVRYPKKVRGLGKLEAMAVEIGVYECNIIAGLLQTPEHARAVIGAAQPPYSLDDMERMVAARLARQSVFERDPAPSIHFVLEEAPLRRRVGGTMGWRQHFEHLLARGLNRLSDWTSRRDDQLRRKIDEFRRQPPKIFVRPASPPCVDPHVAAFDPSPLLQRLPKGRKGATGRPGCSP